MSEHIRLLHINDLHSYFEAYPKIKRFFEEKRSSQQVETLTLDLGDNIDRSHPLTDATLGQPCLRHSAVSADFRKPRKSRAKT